MFIQVLEKAKERVLVMLEMLYCNTGSPVFIQALEKAKEAGRKERVLVKQREQLSLGEQVNLDLTFSVSLFNSHRSFDTIQEDLSVYRGFPTTLVYLKNDI